ncbi:MAG TPA: cell wall hydrolase [Caulobacteraceae bacterium]
MGGAYLAGGVARTSDDQLRSARLARAAAHGFSEGALRAETLTMGPGALALAQHRDPLASGGDHEGQAVSLRVTSPTALAASAAPAAPASGQRPNVMRASFTPAKNPAARPFRFASGDALQSARDLDCLSDAVYYEARGETAAGQAAVAQVVLNRVRHPGFPKSVCGVVFQGVSGDGCQFSFACDGSMHRPKESEAWRNAEHIAARALTGFVMPSVGNATHFHVVGVDPGWGPRLLKVAQVGLHVFYRFGGYSGAPSSFTGQPQPSAPDDAAPAPTLVASATADGRPAGQYILASATVTTPASAPATPPAKPAASETVTTAKPEASPVKAHADTGL